MCKSNCNFGAGCSNWAVWADLRFGFVHFTNILEQNEAVFCDWEVKMYHGFKELKKLL